MKSYKILYKGIEIGILDTDREKNLHKYTHNENGLKQLENNNIKILKIIDFSKDTDWIKPIPFFENRIKNCEKFEENPKEIGYHTDSFRLILIE